MTCSFLVDEDTSAFNKVMEAFALPKAPRRKRRRVRLRSSPQKYAAEIPLGSWKRPSDRTNCSRKWPTKGIPLDFRRGVGALAVARVSTEPR